MIALGNMLKKCIAVFAGQLSERERSELMMGWAFRGGLHGTPFYIYCMGYARCGD